LEYGVKVWTGGILVRHGRYRGVMFFLGSVKRRGYFSDSKAGREQDLFLETRALGKEEVSFQKRGLQ
jgi:hypothetical protein